MQQNIDITIDLHNNHQKKSGKEMESKAKKSRENPKKAT